jgi:hypothetical protein
MAEIRWTPHKGQRETHLSKARFKVLACGRRWGKTLFAWMQLLIKALEKPGLYWWVAPVYKELIPVTQTIKQWTPPEFITKEMQIGTVTRYIKLPNDSEIYFHSARALIPTWV